MRSHPWRVVAAQLALGLLVLLAVYLLLLQPAGPGPLSGVDAPATRGLAPGGPELDGRWGTGTPTFDQYADTVDQISARVRRSSN